ncbi:MAG: hypothetical protein U0800_26980 [Isosphaeraceae bacterium]
MPPADRLRERPGHLRGGGRTSSQSPTRKPGQVPYAGEFEFGHEAPAIRLTASSRLKDGQKLRASWFHPVLTHGTQVMVCPSEVRRLGELLRDQIRRVNDLLHPKTFFLSHDEIRVMNWCDACRARKLRPPPDPGRQRLSAASIVREVRPEAEASPSSDMFDPNHNAVASYYLVNGTWKARGGPAEGRDRRQLERRQEAAEPGFLRQWGHRQILAGYYDADDLSGFTD